MHQDLRALIRQITPPVLLSGGQSLWKKFRPKPTLNPKAVDRVCRLKAEFDRLNSNVPEGRICLRDGLTLAIHPDSRVAFVHFCYSSPVVVDELDCFIRLTSGKKRLLDIGALHGIFSLVFAAGCEGKSAIAVDASPVAFARLLYNIHKNQLSSIQPVECALSDASGTLQMHYEWEHAVAAGTPAGGTGLSITRKAADELCEDLAFSPDVIKIHVEGHEVKVLKGLQKTLLHHRPLLFLEIHPERIRQEGDSVQQIFDLLVPLGYLATSLSGDTVSASDVTSSRQDERLVFSCPTPS